MRKRREGIGQSKYAATTEVVTNAENKRSLAVRFHNLEDDYDGMTLYLTPAQAKLISKLIYESARAMEQRSKKLGE